MKSRTQKSLTPKTPTKDASPAPDAALGADTTRSAASGRRHRLWPGVIGLFGVLGLTAYLLTDGYDTLEDTRASAGQERPAASAQVETAQQAPAASAPDDEPQFQAEAASSPAAQESQPRSPASAPPAAPVQVGDAGIKVNLADEVLFPSGSADLAPSAVAALTRAAVALKQSPYQTVVAGYADSTEISQRLTAKYPTNWELASARAASVVRLLEQQGVPSTQLLAVSFGDNHPVMSNDTPQGRSRNRRIEIHQQPAPMLVN